MWENNIPGVGTRWENIIFPTTLLPPLPFIIVDVSTFPCCSQLIHFWPQCIAMDSILIDQQLLLLFPCFLFMFFLIWFFRAIEAIWTLQEARWSQAHLIFSWSTDQLCLINSFSQLPRVFCQSCRAVVAANMFVPIVNQADFILAVCTSDFSVKIGRNTRITGLKLEPISGRTQQLWFASFCPKIPMHPCVQCA